MSKHAKQTAVKLFESIDRASIKDTWFITCTLPRGENMPVGEFKKVLARYFARLQRAWGDRLAWYWAIEPTEAGTWHVHMIAMWCRGSVPLWKKFVAWNDLAWSSCTRCTHPGHRRSACNVDRARSWAGVVVYLSGYLSPAKWGHYTGGDTGRVHGIRNGQLLPIRPETTELSDTSMQVLRRAVARIIQRRRAGVWVVDRETGARKRQPGLAREIDPVKRRHMSKALARIAAQPGCKLKLIRTRGRAHWRMVEWEDELSVTFDAKTGARREMYLRQRPRREDEYGRPVGTVCVGPSVIRIPYTDSSRLIAWAVAEGRRREEFDASCPI